MGTYVLITPARNEEDYIELTIRSMVQQTVKPLKWVIVSDGSTDRTDDIALSYARLHSWIEVVRMPERNSRHFGGKVDCFNAGYARLGGMEYDFVGSLDADLSFDPAYFEFLLGRFANDATLGVAGTPFSENGSTYDFRYSSMEHVSGACQLFRKECYEDIGGYIPIKGGGIDSVAVMTARMKGWRTRTFTDKVLVHHRPMGTGNGSGKIVANFHFGQKAYRLGWHPLWQMFRSTYQMTKRPFIVGGVALAAGYTAAFLSNMERPISAELVAFQRKDQLRRLRALLRLPNGASQPAGSVAPLRRVQQDSSKEHIK
ncbi:MAG TPA: glycosyltransferase family 2 protein [Bryobacteraceae bacterium]|nr:glycosyltransferase family 2 protein [Bryobacteraceae bacterium]